MKRIYHHYENWEDWKVGFYNNCSGKEKPIKINQVLKMFNSKKLTEKYMNEVIDNWKYSCEHNFTNNTINQIAYLGQAACCLYKEIPATITMEAWSLLDVKVRDRSDMIALKTIKKWTAKNKNIQLCLNIF